MFTVWIVGVDDARLVLRDHRNRTIATFFEDHIEASPLQGKEKAARSKLTDIISELGKGIADDRLLNLEAHGSAVRVDGVEVEQTFNVSISTVSAE